MKKTLGLLLISIITQILVIMLYADGIKLFYSHILVVFFNAPQISYWVVVAGLCALCLLKSFLQDIKTDKETETETTLAKVLITFFTRIAIGGIFLGLLSLALLLV